MLVAGEVTFWEETGWSAGLLIPAFAVINAIAAGVMIVGWVNVMAPKFQRFPDRLRFYSTVDVPSLPAPDSAPVQSALMSERAAP